MNKAIIVGNLVKDLEPKVTNSGKHYVRFTLAVNESREVCDYIECDAWEKNADNLSQYIHKGQKVLVEGRIKTDKWQDQNGLNRYRTYLRVDRVEFIASMSNSSSQTQTPYSEPKKEEFKYPSEQQLSITGTNKDVTGATDLNINPDELPFY